MSKVSSEWRAKVRCVRPNLREEAYAEEQEKRAAEREKRAAVGCCYCKRHDGNTLVSYMAHTHSTTHTALTHSGGGFCSGGGICSGGGEGGRGGVRRPILGGATAPHDRARGGRVRSARGRELPPHTCAVAGGNVAGRPIGYVDADGCSHHLC